MPDGLARVADRFGIRVVRRNEAFRLFRGSQVFEMPLPPRMTPHERRDIWATLLGVRLAADRLESSYDFSTERPAQSDRATQLSLYGARESRLVPRLTVRTVEALSGDKPVEMPWSDDLVEVFVTAWKREWHVFADPDFDRVGFDRNNLREFARYTLFHDEGSQKPRPVVETVPSGKLKVFRHGDGRMAARAVLMPDYDWDATMQRGVFALPSYDAMVVGQPDTAGDERMTYEVAARARQIWLNDAYPLITAVFNIDLNTSIEGLNPAPGTLRRQTDVFVNRILS